MKKEISKALGLLFPPFCVHCKTLLPYSEESALCPECQKLWDEEKRSVCKSCYKEVSECECVPHRASKRIKKCFHVAEYDAENDSVLRSILINCKDHDYKYVYELAVNELEALLRTRMRTLKNTVITYVPRKREKVMKFGVDQSLICARELSKRLDIELVNAFRREGGREQKALDSQERMNNAMASYSARESAILAVNSRIVILYDDVVTTGASVSACAELLKTMGARTVYVLCLGRTYPKGKKVEEIK